MTRAYRLVSISACMYWVLAALALLALIFLRADSGRRRRRHLPLAALLSCAEAFVCTSMNNASVAFSDLGLVLFAVATQIGAISFLVLILDPDGCAGFKNVACNVLCFLIAILGWAL